MSHVVAGVIIVLFACWIAYELWDDAQKVKLTLDIIAQLRAQGQFNVPLTSDYLAEAIQTNPKSAHKILGRLTTSGELEWNWSARAFFVLPKKRAQGVNNYYGK